jgi:fatty acid synthase subunit alpha, fungi type
VELVHDLEPIEVADSEAQKFKMQHGDKCDVWAGEGGQWLQNSRKVHAFSYRRRSNSVVRSDPDAGRYGIPEDIVAQADRATLWALVCTAEALNASGISDPYELYKYMHPSEVGTCIGSGMEV